ncbi:MAG TPA: response regulator [Kofleriaceae bacterium]
MIVLEGMSAFATAVLACNRPVRRVFGLPFVRQRSTASDRGRSIAHATRSCRPERMPREPAHMLPASVILVAEDDPAMRHLMTDALSHAGFEVIEAADGAELESWIDRVFERCVEPRAIDLIISDQCMPIVSGLDLLARLRRASWSTPFILITGFEDKVTREEAHRLGAASVLDKPFNLIELCAAALHFAPPMR